MRLKKSKICVFVMMLILLIGMSIPAYADEPDSSGTETGEETTEDADYGVAGSMLDVIFSGWGSDDDLNDLSYRTLIQESQEVTSEVLNDLTGGSGTLSDIYVFFKSLAVVLLTIHFLLTLSTRDYTQDFGRMTIEMAVKPWLKYLVCIVFISISEYFLKFFFALAWMVYMNLESVSATDILGSIDAAADVDTTSMTALLMDYYGWKTDGGIVATMTNFITTITVVVAYLLPWVISVGCTFVTGWVIYSRTVNLILKTVFAPIAMSDIYSDQPIKDTRAGSYLREYAGLCFQIVVILFVMLILSVIASSLLSGGVSSEEDVAEALSNFSIKVAIYKLVQIGALVGSANTAKKIFGAG